MVPVITYGSTRTLTNVGPCTKTWSRLRNISILCVLANEPPLYQSHRLWEFMALFFIYTTHKAEHNTATSSKSRIQ